MTDLSRLFRPRSVAIVGASDKNPWSAIVTRCLENIGFVGRVHLVNRRGTPALGRQTAQSCVDLEAVDAAFVAVPAVALRDALEDMAAGGIRYGAVVTSGFAETGGDGAVEQARIFDRARELGLTLLGPNSLGFTNFVNRVSLGAIPLTLPPLERPRVGMVSQSGATAAMIYSLAYQQNVSLSYSIAMGNEAMVDLADVIEFLTGDEATKSIAVFAETIRNPPAFERAARAARAAGKPIVILKVGTGAVTAAVAQAHTGALVGDDRVFEAVCESLNILRVKSFEDLVVTADVLAALGPINPSKGFGLISISGGACEVVADRGEEAGLQFPPFAPSTRAALVGVLADFGAAHNPLDITGAAMSNPRIYSGSMHAVSADPAIGLFGVVAEIPANREADSPMSAGMLSEIALGFRVSSCPGLVIQQTFKPVSAYGREVIDRNNLPAVTGGLDHAVRAIGLLYKWSRGQLAAPTAEVRTRTSSADKPVTEHQALAYLAAAGVPVIPQHVVHSSTEAAHAARALNSPAVLKILSPDIQHKTEVGGVQLNLLGDEIVAAAFDRIVSSVQTARPDARIDGVIVSPMRSGGLELFVGIARDPSWGLAMAVGLGGVWIELLGDAILQMLPVTPAAVLAMLRRLKAAKLLEGYRGSKPVNLDRLAQVIAAIGDAALGLGDDLEALEINPLRVDESEVEALDALALWRQP